MSDKEKIIEMLDAQGIDPRITIREVFLGYKFRKWRNKLYTGDLSIVTNLIRMYYLLNPDEAEFDNIKTAFVRNYVRNESKLEGINDESIHGKTEMEGLQVMYEYIYSGEISQDDYNFNIYDLKTLHKKLFSKTPFPECAGKYRTMSDYLPGTGTELCDASLIERELYFIDKEIIQPLVRIGKYIKENQTVTVEQARELKVLAEDYSVVTETTFTRADALMLYLDACVVLGCKIIKIHPFRDGNGRSVRGFMNKLLTDVGLPPTYVKANERTEYHNAMNKANRERDYNPDYTDIKNFYLYKICDSIIELDINEKLKPANSSIDGYMQLSEPIVDNNEQNKQKIFKHPNSVN